jgi:hypothetical protein
MKGIIFRFLEEFITKNCGEDKFQELVAHCPMQTKEPFVGPGTYPDGDFFSIFNATVKDLGLAHDDALRLFGEFCFPRLAGRYPHFVTPYAKAKPFLLTVDAVIHIEVRKLLKDAVLPKFYYDDPDPQHLIIVYQSERRLCRFMEGLLDGVGKHFGERITQEQRKCTYRGDNECEFLLSFDESNHPGA